MSRTGTHRLNNSLKSVQCLIISNALDTSKKHVYTVLFVRMRRGGTSPLHRSTHFTNTTCSPTQRMTTTGTTTQHNQLITQNQTNQMTTNAINQNNTLYRNT